MDAQAFPAVGQVLGPGGLELLLIRFRFHFFTGSLPPVSCTVSFCFAILVQMLTMTRTVSVETGSNLERAVGLGADHGLELLSLLKIT
jgi:hypothetical protein